MPYLPDKYPDEYPPKGLRQPLCRFAGDICSRFLCQYAAISLACGDTNSHVRTGGGARLRVPQRRHPPALGRRFPNHSLRLDGAAESGALIVMS